MNESKTPRQYKDVSGNPVSLGWLVLNEPEWAKNQILHRDKLETELAEAKEKLSMSVGIEKVNELLLKLAYKQRDTQKLESDLVAMTASRDKWRGVAEENNAALHGTVKRLRLALAELGGETLNIPDAPTSLGNLKAVMAACEAFTALKQEEAK